MQSLQFSKYFPLPKNGGHFEFSNFCQKWQKHKFASISLTVRDRAISSKSLDLAQGIKEMQICVLPFLAKIQNGRHFWGGENILKIAKIALLRYPVCRKFCRNRSISHG